MPSTNRNHGAGVWREAAQSGGAPTATPRYLVYDGSDVVIDSDGPEDLVFFKIGDASGDPLIDLAAPAYIVADGSDYTIDHTGPNVAQLIADGDDLTLSDDTTLPRAADLLDDLSGDTWIVARNAQRYRLSKVRNDFFLS